MRPTENRRRVLERLANSPDPLVIHDFRDVAPDRVRLKGEWAGPNLRWAVNQGLVETCGSRQGCTLHRITATGRRAVTAAQEAAA